MVKLHMSETISMIPKSYEKSVILGGAGSPEKKTTIANKIDVVANQINEILKIEPVDDLAKNKIYNKSGDVIDGLKIGVSDVEEMNAVLVDTSKTDKQKEIMTSNLEILAKGTFIAMQYGGNQEMVDLLGRGSAKEIDDMLPKPLNGLGERVLKNIFTNEQVLGVLKELDQKSLEDGWKLMPPTIEEKRAVLETYARNLARLDKDIPEGHPERDELIMALSYLQTGLLDLKEKTNTLQQGEVSTQQKSRSKRSENDEGLSLRGEIKVPKEVEGQRLLARKILDIVEFKQLEPWSIEGDPYRDYLDNIRKEKGVDSDVKQEIVTRLKLQQIMGAMAGASGWLGADTPKPIMRMLDDAKGKSGLFDVDDMRFLFENKKNGISKTVNKAWTVFEEINAGEATRLPPLPDGKPGRIICGPYHEILLRMQKDSSFCREMGIDTNNDSFFRAGMLKPEIVDKEKMWEDAYDNYFLDANKKRREAVNAFIAKEIKKKDRTITKEESIKGVELAWNLMVATGETSVFNTAFAGHNDLSELMLTKYDTLDRMSRKKGKTIGSLTCMERIVSLAPTWLRYMSDRTVFGPLKSEEIQKNIGRLDEVEKWGIEYWYGPMVTQKISEVKRYMRDAEKMGAKELVANPEATLKSLGEFIGKVSKFPSVILDENGKPIVNTAGKIDRDTGQLKINNTTGEILVDKLDSHGRPLIVTPLETETREKRIRFLMVAGWAERAVSNKELGWDQASWRTFRGALTRGYVFDENKPNEKMSFISSDDLNKIERKILGKLLNTYTELKVLEEIREAEKKGVPLIVKANNNVFSV